MILLYVVELVDIVLIQDIMCGIILYFTNPDCCIHVAEGISIVVRVGFVFLSESQMPVVSLHVIINRYLL